MAGCSQEHLCRLLRRFEDRSPKQFIRRQRIQRLVYLCRTDATLSNARLAEMYGFSSIRTMTRQVHLEIGENLRTIRRTPTQTNF